MLHSLNYKILPNLCLNHEFPFVQVLQQPRQQMSPAGHGARGADVRRRGNDAAAHPAAAAALQGEQVSCCCLVFRFRKYPKTPHVINGRADLVQPNIFKLKI